MVTSIPFPALSPRLSEPGGRLRRGQPTLHEEIPFDLPELVISSHGYLATIDLNLYSCTSIFLHFILLSQNCVHFCFLYEKLKSYESWQICTAYQCPEKQMIRIARKVSEIPPYYSRYIRKYTNPQFVILLCLFQWSICHVKCVIFIYIIHQNMYSRDSQAKEKAYQLGCN